MGGALGAARQLAARGPRVLAQPPPGDCPAVPRQTLLGISGIDRAEVDWHGRQRRHAEEQAPGKEVHVC
eukprot:3131032-Pyramimonas_sp.AAC.1